MEVGKTHYRPGVRNISDQQVKYRRQIGTIGLVLSLAVLIALVVIRANYIFGLIIFLPACIAAIGYLQAGHRFCIFFGTKGQYSSSDADDVAPVTDSADHELDLACSRMISVQATMVGLAAALVTCAALFLL